MPKKTEKQAAKPRKLKSGEYKTLRLQKRIKHLARLPNVLSLAKSAWRLLMDNKKLFLGITLVYGLLNLLLVQGLTAGTNVSELKAQLEQVFTGNFGSVASSLSVFVVLVSSAGNSDGGAAAVYQVFLAIIASLAIIWSLRQASSGVKIRIRDSYYQGMYPLIPFIIVLLVIGLQCLPMLLGASIYSIVTANGIAILAVEKLLWAVLYALMTLLTLYLISSSLFALYISTLPDMTPMKALRSARELVRHRRWTVMRKILALPIILLLVAAFIMLPIIIWLTPLAQWTFFVLTMLSLTAIHGYMYTLYRELLHD